MIDQQLTAERLGIALLICVHTILCCASLVYLADSHVQVSFDPVPFHLLYNSTRLPNAATAVAAFTLISLPFCFVRFSIGYGVSFYFYTMISGYLWLNSFTDLSYDHRLATLSAAASAATFFLPALFIVSPITQAYALSANAFDRLLTLILLLAVAVIITGAQYNFRVVGVTSIYNFRDDLQSPSFVNYSIGIVSTALLPFSFAGSIARKTHWRAAAALLLLLLIYPINLSKLALLAPFWCAYMLLLSRIFSIKVTVIVSLLAPVLIGLILHLLFNRQTNLYFSIVNFRLIAVPSNALDIYNDFFSRHEPTYFCQISILKLMMPCPYQEPLGTLMRKVYDLGNLNASLFATEGVASVGLMLAPVATFGCGLVIALGNRLSAGLPPRFILLSSAVLIPVLLNVPLSTVMITHGGALLFLLWYVTPRTIFDTEWPNRSCKLIDERAEHAVNMLSTYH